MTAPLYDIKAKFSEYVTRAENGDVIEITKHGTATVVMISLSEYEKLKSSHEQRIRPTFTERIQKWRTANKALLQDDFMDKWVDSLEQDRTKDGFEQESNPWQ